MPAALATLSALLCCVAATLSRISAQISDAGLADDDWVYDGWRRLSSSDGCDDDDSCNEIESAEDFLVSTGEGFTFDTETQETTVVWGENSPSPFPADLKIIFHQRAEGAVIAVVSVIGSVQTNDSIGVPPLFLVNKIRCVVVV